MQPPPVPEGKTNVVTMMNKDGLCLVTGVSGCLGLWIAADLPEHRFRIRGTVRDLNDEAKVNTMRTLLAGVELVAVDPRRQAVCLHKCSSVLIEGLLFLTPHHCLGRLRYCS